MKEFLPVLTVSKNRKGVLDIDTVKGCMLGMQAYPDGGCYGVCYAAKMAKLYGFDFTKPITRKSCNRAKIENAVKHYESSWFRIGVMGEPCHDWDWTIEVCEWLSKHKTPVIVTKSWIDLTDNQINTLHKCKAIINISISPLDSEDERNHRLGQFLRLKDKSMRVVLRIVSVNCGNTLFNNLYGERIDGIQRNLFSYSPIIDNPLRLPSKDIRVLSGDILTQKRPDINSNSTMSISIFSKNVYVGKCENCPDICGIAFYKQKRGEEEIMADVDNVLLLVKEEYQKATIKFTSFNSAHEGYAVIKEEVDELWDDIKGNVNLKLMEKEAVQVAAMAIRFILDICEVKNEKQAN